MQRLCSYFPELTCIVNGGHLILQVSNNTALSLAEHSRNLVTLDLSWCRNLTNEALGLIVDSCLSLEVLKLFGCTQVFVDWLANYVKL